MAVTTERETEMILIDTETSGLLLPEGADLATQPWAIEIAVLKLGPKYKEVARYTTLLKPGAPIDEELHKKITGLTNADLAKAPTFLEVYGALAAFCLGETMIVAHNMSFDLGILVNELRRIGKEFAFPFPPEQICTVEASKHILGRRMKLTELYEHLTKKKLKQTHRAMDDVEALVQVVKGLKL